MELASVLNVIMALKGCTMFCLCVYPFVDIWLAFSIILRLLYMCVCLICIKYKCKKVFWYWNHLWLLNKINSKPNFFIMPPTQRSWRGVLVSPCPSFRTDGRVRPSVCLSICGQNHICSVSSTILAGSMLYLHILSSNFRRCVVWSFF